MTGTPTTPAQNLDRIRELLPQLRDARARKALTYWAGGPADVWGAACEEVDELEETIRCLRTGRLLVVDGHLVARPASGERYAVRPIPAGFDAVEPLPATIDRMADGLAQSLN